MTFHRKKYSQNLPARFMVIKAATMSLGSQSSEWIAKGKWTEPLEAAGLHWRLICHYRMIKESWEGGGH